MIPDLPTERIYYERLAHRLTTLRVLHGVTKAQLARSTGIARRTIQRWANGEGGPGLYDLERMGRLFNMTVIEMLSVELPDAAECAAGARGGVSETRRQAVR